MRNQSPLRRRESGKKSGGQGEKRRQTLDGGGREGHPTWDHRRPGQPARLAAVGRATLDALEDPLGELPDRVRVHLDRAYDSDVTRRKLAARCLIGEISEKGKPSPLKAGKRWVVERTNSWHNAHKKLVWCTERSGRVIDFWVAFSEVVIIVRRLIREGWSRYRWESRPSRRP